MSRSIVVVSVSWRGANERASRQKFDVTSIGPRVVLVKEVDQD